MTSNDSLTNQPRRILADRYELGEILGYGGMAEVRRGRDLRLGRDVAIKTLRVDLARDTSFQTRFRREAQAAAALNHPSIVAVYDTGESMLDGVPVPYIVMEYVEGRTLRDILKSESHILPRRALEIVADILAALEYSHRNGIVHRDIKPGNIMLTRNGEVKVMDFGIARAVAQSTATVTQTAAVIGTAQYLSPEQARGEPVDPRSDIYSTGCVLYELLTGTPPFTGESAVAVAYQHVREDPVPPSRLNPDVTPDIDAIVMKALAKNPANRYQSAAEMRADIERALLGKPVQATPLLLDPTERLSAVTEEIRPAQPRTRRGLIYTLLAAAVLALLVALGLLARQLITGSHATPTLPVPNVINMTQSQAEQTLTSDGFKVKVETQPNASVPQGIVFDQNPTAGTRLPKNSVVTITVSAGPKTVTVPDLTNKSLEDARAALRALGLTVGNVTQRDSQQPAGTVLDQNPKPGSPAAAGSRVDLVVASGTGTVPDVRGLPASDAEQELTSAGYAYNVVEEPSNDVQQGFVINQVPGPGRTAPLGSTVTLYVSSGTPSASPSSSASASPSPSGSPSSPAPSPSASSSP
ncbi:MAG: Stk1 family PASTA domain-containing Ser/Thr kinase [Acidothermus cellulolyticus]|nr:Stk1 family PASTA domain-containing Ser/Thr kinase [Acidothermus cellulolyticus]